ncbi:DExH-box ATP-dependent RNA helicase DExH12 [Heracleum sosnowskyi]|uniref:DExH-box ATP-dependent RNA helicase DExH12 n=1 Tax=Heracleum sosnowskyi TaxID=360622 RepID=A0AAD8I1P4_9APIA|nr:DExH-box ATP-dependent RNA helicase DExH12 [Heracleum sosnowskyi]
MEMSSSLVLRGDSGAPRNHTHEATTGEEAEISSFSDNDIMQSLGPALIACKYDISYATVERFSASLTKETKLKECLEILTSAVEFEQFSIRPGEEELIRSLFINNQRFSFDNPNCRDPHVKANALLQAHFSGQPLHGDLAADQKQVVLIASRLLPAMVDVIFFGGWLWLANCAMKVSQMVTQGLWDCDSMLLQLPYFTKELAQRCEDNPGTSVTSVYDFLEMEEHEWRDLLQMPDAQLFEIAKVCKRIPDIDLALHIQNSANIRAEEVISLHIIIERNLVGRTEVGPVYAPKYPKLKEEGWWVMVSDAKTNQLLAMKRVCVKRKSEKVKLDFAAPGQTGRKTYALYVICDSYIGCDLKHYFSVDVKSTGARKDDDYMKE